MPFVCVHDPSAAVVVEYEPVMRSHVFRAYDRGLVSGSAYRCIFRTEHRPLIEPVRGSYEAGGECCITFVYEQDGVLVYPDRVMVKVCCERGVVTGLEGHEYLKNHCEREIGAAKVSMEKVERNAAKKMQLHGVRKAIIPVDGQERLTYEVRGEYGGRMYYAYIDAVTGETAEIRVVADTDRGMSLL